MCSSDRVAPYPGAFPAPVAKLVQLDMTPYAWSPEAVEAITAPTLIIVGDSDGIRPDHAVAMFRLRGGGVFGDLAGLPAAQLAILPGTTYVGILDRAEWLLAMISPFLDAPLPSPNDQSGEGRGASIRSTKLEGQAPNPHDGA